MAEIKNTFLKGKMNKDLDERLLSKGEYRHALNVEISSSEGQNVGTVQNILGNYELPNPISSSEYKCIGSISDEKNNRLYWFVTSKDIDLILEWDDLEQKSSLVFVDPNKKNSNATLKFPNTYITGINIIDDFLLWTDGINEPKKINIKKSKLGSDQNQAPINKHTKLVVDNVVTDFDATEKYITVIKDRPQSPPTVKVNANKNKSERGIFEKVLPRFCYRYKYADGEYSAFGPFTNVVFSAKHSEEVNAENFYSSKEKRNVSMVNSIESVELLDFVPSSMPKDVVQVDLLYKSENSNVVYSVANVKKEDKEFKAKGSSQNVDPIYESNSPGGVGLNEINKGRYLITTENIYAALPENQILRPWDNVPRSAKAQEITGSRIVYANYKQGYDLKGSVTLDASFEKRNTRENSILEGGVETIKSLRDYQLGVVYGDDKGRETPVFSSSEGSVKVPWLSEVYSSPNYYNPLCLTAAVKSQVPDWASYFKFYVKETSGEYYNLLMDKLYIPSQSTDFENKEEHVWLSFPSTEINKITEEDYIILKRVSGSTVNPVEEKSRYKISSISTEAPDSIAYNYISLGEITNADDILANDEEDAAIFPNVERRIDKETDVIEVDRSNSLEQGIPLLRALGNVTNNGGVDNSSNIDDLYVAWKKVSSGVTTHSKRYKVSSNEFIGTSYTMKLSEKITQEDAALAAGSSDANLGSDITFSIFRKDLRTGEDFSGKFFVKIFSDDIIKSKILNLNSNISTNKFISSSKELFWWADETTGIFENTGILNAPISSTTPNVLPSGTADVVEITNTASEWDNVLISQGKAFFIDNMYMAAANVSSTSYAKEAGQGVVANPVEYAELNWRSNFNDENDVYPWNLNGDTSWAQSNTSFVDWSTTLRNSIPGIITSDSDNIEGGKFVWKDSIFGLAETNKTYGENAGGHFMHVSFLAPGKDLHDGSFDGASDLNNVDVFGENSIAGLLKGIWGGGAFTDEFGASLGLDADGQDVKFVEFEGNYIGESPVGDAPAPGVGKGYDLEYREYHERQWDPTFSPGDSGFSSAIDEDKNVEDFVKKIAIGKKFKFENDSTEQLFTILDVQIKHVYNHTPWRSNWKYTIDGIVRGNDSVEEAAVAWAKAKLTNNVTDEDATLIERIINFGKASNRRTVYILRLDKNPTLGNYNILGGSSDNISFTTSEKMQFVDTDAHANSGLIKDVQAIFETEPKEALDLNIFYEASQAIPTYLTLENASQFAPIGCRVEFVDLPEARRGDETISNIIHVASWKHTDSGELAFICQQENGFGANARGFNKLNSNGVQIDYVDARVRFYRPDGSFTTCRLGPMQDAGQGPSGLRRLFIVNRVVDITEETGLSWFNCFTFGDGVESNRIEDNFNSSFIKNGAKASTTLDEPYSEEHRKYGLIYSGLYNASSGLNNLNQFIQAEKITKDLNPTYGSIQKLFSRRADLIAFCEDRVIKILANKDAVFNADGNPQLVATTNVLGQATPFVGDYGISTNPESFSSESYRAYFTDKQRGAVLRLSMDGLTPISDAGMHDFFRDELPKAGIVLGTYDEYKRQYNVSFKDFIYNNILKNSYLAEGDELNVSSYSTEVVLNPNLETGIDYVQTDISSIYNNGGANVPILNPEFDAGVEITYFPAIPAGGITQYAAEGFFQPAVYDDITAPIYGAITVNQNANGDNVVTSTVPATDDFSPAQNAVMPTFQTSAGYMHRLEPIDSNNSTPGNNAGGFINDNGTANTYTGAFQGAYVQGANANGGAASSFQGNYEDQISSSSVFNGIRLSMLDDWGGSEQSGNFIMLPGNTIVAAGAGGNSWNTDSVPSNMLAEFPDATNVSVFTGEEVWIKINYSCLYEFASASPNSSIPHMDVTVTLGDGVGMDNSQFRSTPLFTALNNQFDIWQGGGEQADDNVFTSTNGYYANTTSLDPYPDYVQDTNETAQLLSYGTPPSSGTPSFTFTVPGVQLSGGTYTQNGGDFTDDSGPDNIYGVSTDLSSIGTYKAWTGFRSMIIKTKLFPAQGQNIVEVKKIIDELQVKIEIDTVAPTKHHFWLRGFAVYKGLEMTDPGSVYVPQSGEDSYDVFGESLVNLQQPAYDENGNAYGSLATATDEYGNIGTATQTGTAIIQTGGGSNIVTAASPEVLAFPDAEIPAFVAVKHILPNNWSGNASGDPVNLTHAIEQLYGPENPAIQETHVDEMGNTTTYFTENNINTVATYSASNNGTTINSYDSIALGPHHGVVQQETISDIDNSFSFSTPTSGQSCYAEQAQTGMLQHDEYYMLDLGYDESNTIISGGYPDFHRVNGGTIGLTYAVDFDVAQAAHKATHENQITPSSTVAPVDAVGNNNYTAGYFGQISASGSVNGRLIFMPTTATEYGVERNVLRVVFKASQDRPLGLDKIRLQAYGLDSELIITDATLINVSEQGAGNVFSSSWVANTTNLLTTALDQPVAYYQNGGWVWDLFEDDAASQNTLTQDLNGQLLQSTIEGYTLSFEIRNAPDYDPAESGQANGVEGSLEIHIVTDAWPDGQHRVIQITNITSVGSEGNAYSIPFNLDGSGVGTIVQPSASNINVTVTTQDPSSISYAADSITILPGPSGFYGKIDTISIQDDSEIVSGGSTDSWVFTSYDQVSLESNPIQPSSEYLFEDEQIVFASALKNIQVSQAISQEINEGETYEISVDVDYDEGQFDIYYFSKPGVGFVISSGTNPSSITVTKTVEQGLDYYQDGMITGALVFVTTGNINTFSLDNITMTKVATESVNEQTLSYSEDVNGWVSFKSYIPEEGDSISKKYFTFKNGRIYQHYHEESSINTFYNVPYISTITTVLNDESGVVKLFKTLSYEGDQARVLQQDSIGNDAELYNFVGKEGWQVSNISTNIEQGSVKEFIEKENKWFNYIKGAGEPQVSNLNFQGIGVLSQDPILLEEEIEEIE